MNRKILLWIGALVVLGAAGGLYFYATRPPPPQAATAPPAAVATTPPPAEPPPITNPVPAAPGAAPLPDLDASDAPLRAGLEELTGAAALGDLLRPEDLVRHIVATVDSLPRAGSTPAAPLRRQRRFMALGPTTPRSAIRACRRAAPTCASSPPSTCSAGSPYSFLPLFQQVLRPRQSGRLLQ
jgi:hypothetical protein